MVFNFDDFRSFLKSYLRQLPKKGHGEARKIAIELGISSTYISQVLSGIRQLTLEQSLDLCEYLNLTGLEQEYFINLVHLDRAGNVKLKKFYREQLEKIKQKSLKLSNLVPAERALSETEKAIYYSSALYSAILIFTATKPGGVLMNDVVERFQISRKKASEILKFLSESNLAIEKNGFYSIGMQSVHLESTSPFLLKHHTNWRLRAIQAAEELAENELMYTLNIAISEKDFELFRSDMIEFVKNFLKKAYPSPSEKLACFNLDFFWIRK